MPYVLVLFVITLVGGGWTIFSLYEDKALLSANEETLKTAIEMTAQELELREKDFELKRKQVNEKQKQIAKLYQTTANLNAELKELSKNDKTVSECFKTTIPDPVIVRLRLTVFGSSEGASNPSSKID